jgi:beta-alanine--pyruvate transaminase
MLLQACFVFHWVTEEKKLLKQVHNQLLKLDYSPSFQVSHLPAFACAEKVANMLPGDLNNVFFTICGSTAIDSAIKIVQAYQHAIGQSHRMKFVSRERAYHGVNIGWNFTQWNDQK